MISPVPFWQKGLLLNSPHQYSSNSAATILRRQKAKRSSRFSSLPQIRGQECVKNVIIAAGASAISTARLASLDRKKKKSEMTQAAHSYVVSFEVESRRQGRRHHWIICRAQNPEVLVSWGHAPTQELAEIAAEKEVQDLSSGVTRGGQASSTFETFSRHNSVRF
jgi:hypothetical protein